MTTNAVDAVVDYRAESRSGPHVLDVAARSEAGGLLHIELTVSDRVGDLVGEGALRLPPDLLPPAERLLGQVLRGLGTLHSLPAVPAPRAAPGTGPTRRADPARPARPPRPMDPDRPNACRPWSAEEHQRLRAAWEAGEPVPAIAAAHGRSRNAIRSRLLKLGLITLDHPESPAAARPDPTPPAVPRR